MLSMIAFLSPYFVTTSFMFFIYFRLILSYLFLTNKRILTNNESSRKYFFTAILKTIFWNVFALSLFFWWFNHFKYLSSDDDDGLAEESKAIDNGLDGWWLPIAIWLLWLSNIFDSLRFISCTYLLRHC